jgi:Fe-S cluster assembly protein SufD
MIDVMAEKGLYLSHFARFAKESSTGRPPWLVRLRKAAIARFGELGFPTLKDEEWRFTNVAPLTRVAFQPAPVEPHGLTPEKLQWAALWVEEGSRLAFVNGRYAPALSSVRNVPGGMVVDSLAAVLEAHPEWVEPHLARYADYKEHAFTALNTAFVRDGAFVSIPKGQVLREPVHVLFVSTTRGEPAVSHPRNLILAGVNSQATVIESYIGLDKDIYFTNAVTEIVALENAVIDHYKLAQEGEEAFHVATLQVQQGRGSNFTGHSIMLGGALVRNDVNAVLGAEGCECTLNGLYLAAGRQHVDNHTRIDHAKPHCTSHELYKGILDGKSRGVFNGKIFVHQNAQKTDAKQTNKTLLLSEDAVIDTKPQLEIYADDVKCTHGATIGQLAEEAIFYLRSRGIGRAEARSLLTYAFANDIIGRVKVEPIRAQLEDVLLRSQSLPGGRQVEEAAP